MRNGWKETTLGQSAISSWGNTETTKSKYVTNGYIAYSASGADGFLEWFEHDCDAVVLSAIGAQCGKTWFANGKWTSIKNTIWIKGNENVLLDKYLYYLSNQEHFWQIRGQAQPFISLGDLKTTKINLPPLPEQKRIVDLISAVDSYIDALEQQAENARKSRSAVLHEMLSAGGDDLIETTLGEAANWGSGGTPKADNPDFYGGEIPWCVIGDLTESDVWDTEKKITKLGLVNSSAKIIDPGSVLLAMYGASIGRTGISAIPMATNQAIAFARCNTEMVTPKYLLVYLQTQKAKFVEMGQGAAQPNISQTIIKSWPISLPNLAFQHKLISMIDNFDSILFGLQSSIESTRLLRTSLLSDLLSGDHEIPESYDKVIGAA